MKTIFAILLLFSMNSILAQDPLIVDAGEDRHLCLKLSEWAVNSGDPVLGGNIVASGGVPPYTYAWEFRKLYFGSVYVNASDILDDTTKEHPEYKKFRFSNNMNIPYIKLTVTDSQGNKSVDSIHVTHSAFSIHLTEWEYYINKGDSVYLNQEPNIGPGIEPLSYSWTPNDGILNPDQRNFWSKPDQTIKYSVIVTDAMGCSVTGSPFYTVHVTTVGISDDKNITLVHPFPNPTKEFIELSDNYSKFEIISEDGRKLLEGKGEKHLDVSELPCGNYILNAFRDSALIGSYKFVKD